MKKKTLLILFGNKVRALRIRRGFSQEQLAHKTKLDRSYLGRIERGEVNTTLVKMYKIARGLGIKVKDLLTL